MVNKIQNICYKISILSPLFIMLAVVLRFQKVSWRSCFILGIIGVIFFAYSFIFIWVCLKKLPPIKVNITDISPNDNWVIGYIIAYMVPYVSLAISDINSWIASVVALLFLATMIRINNASFNPVLMLAGFHCYRITLGNGISNCILLSRRRGIRNNEQIKSILRIEDYLLIDNDRR